MVGAGESTRSTVSRRRLSSCRTRVTCGSSFTAGPLRDGGRGRFEDVSHALGFTGVPAATVEQERGLERVHRVVELARRAITRHGAGRHLHAGEGAAERGLVV